MADGRNRKIQPFSCSGHTQSAISHQRGDLFLSQYAAGMMGSMTEKVVTTAQLIPLLERARREKQRIVFTNGCFDLMHIGHTRYLQAAKALGDILVVGVNSDTSVKSLKKAPDRPIVGEAQRAEVVAAIGCVDYVVIFAEPDPLNLITALQPDVLVKGGDWPVDRIIGRDVVERRGGTVKTIPLVPGMSTTALIERVRSQTH
jgi:rfaE bifunctional protein nucleotidyltransferase chain/domain